MRARMKTLCSVISGNKRLVSGLTYKKAGVNIDAGNELVKRIAKLNPSIGGFAGNFQLGDDYLVASTDGVGSKLKVAIEMNRHDTIGIDLVAMNVNDIITCGAKPLLFLDYFATGRLDVDVAEQVIKGIMTGCEEAGCVLIGGETAELPSLLKSGDYDMAGFVIGIVKKSKYIYGDTIKKGDVVMGIPSSGLHSNGYSLVWKVLEQNGLSVWDKTPWSPYHSFGEELITPTRIYVKDIHNILKKVDVKGLAHITGGGMVENVPRMFPTDKNLGVYIDTQSWVVPKMFDWLEEYGNISIHEMRRVFNMGIGMVIVVSEHDVEEVQKTIPDARVIGEVYYKKKVNFIG